MKWAKLDSAQIKIEFMLLQTFVDFSSFKNYHTKFLFYRIPPPEKKDISIQFYLFNGHKSVDYVIADRPIPDLASQLLSPYFISTFSLSSFAFFLPFFKSPSTRKLTSAEKRKKESGKKKKKREYRWTWESATVAKWGKRRRRLFAWKIYGFSIPQFHSLAYLISIFFFPKQRITIPFVHLEVKAMR